jgi:hypothetical protein
MVHELNEHRPFQTCLYCPSVPQLPVEEAYSDNVPVGTMLKASTMELEEATVAT